MAEELIKISIDQEESFYIENGDYDKTLRTIIQEHKNKEKNGNVLQLKSVQDICDGAKNFYIADYQRGYRWGEDEVEALLNDIYEVYKKDDSGQKYCLQPLVVTENKECVFSAYLEKDGVKEQKSKEGCHELLDGQQRLTTIFLIIETIKQLIDDKRNTYRIYYELVRPIDREFIANTIKREEVKGGIIKQWFCRKSDFNSNHQDVYRRKTRDHEPGDCKNPNWQKKELEKYLNVIYTNLVFIWYEVKEDVNEELFRKINKGKIELTNAELFKAMLLNDENARTGEESRELERISFEWDKIEQSLRNDEFWFFISNNKSEERTRIDYILEVYARSLKVAKEYDILKDRYSFLVVQDYLLGKKDNAGNIDFESIKTVWKEIVSVHDKLYSWYRDDELYHNIGFLVACEGRRRSAAAEIIVDLYRATKDKNMVNVKSYVKGKIQTIFAEIAKHTSGGENENKEYLNGFDVDTITYDINKKDLCAFLLYSNIYPIIKVIQKCEAELKSIKEEKSESEKKKRIEMLNETHIERFPFKKYYQIDWDIEHINPQTPITGKDAEAKFAFDESYLKIYKEEYEKYMQNKSSIDENSNEINAVSNLVLLDSTTNRQYHNAIFGFKRYCIIQRDKSGKYILPQTRRVFLKYDNLHPTWLEWTKQDQCAYMKELIAMIKYVQGEQQEV